MKWREWPMEPEPKFVQVISGWAVVAEHWAVFGSTKEEALNKFREAERKHEEIATRQPPDITQQA